MALNDADTNVSMCPHSLTETEEAFMASTHRAPNYPIDEPITLITSPQDAAAILRAPGFKSTIFTTDGTNHVPVVVDAEGNVHRLSDDLEERPPGATTWTDLTVGSDTMFSLHGERHTRRRKALQPLFGRGAHQWYTDAAILPATERHLAKALSNVEADGVVRADMKTFGHDLFLELAALLVGIDVDSEERLAELGAVFARNTVARASIPNDMQSDDAMTISLKAHHELYESFFAPSLKRRRDLVAAVERGELDESQLPRDMLTLVAQGAETFETFELTCQSALGLFSGSTTPSTFVMVEMVYQLILWFDKHPEDRHLSSDADFMGKALRETLRLVDPGTRAITRRCLEDFECPSGQVIAKGDFIAIFLHSVNRAPEVYGEDASSFNPNREIAEGFRPYGFTFGSGMHMCVAAPLVLGQGGLTGTIAPVVTRLFEHGIYLDPDRPIIRSDSAPLFEEIRSLPVCFAAPAETERTSG
jgi:cytochrome P450